MIEFNKDNNYGGSNEKQKKFTKYIIKKIPKMNKLWYYHDIGYEKSMAQDNLFMVLVSKYLNDIELLINGIWYNLFTKNIFIGITGILITIFSFILIILYTPIYIKNHYKFKRIQ